MKKPLLLIARFLCMLCGSFFYIITLGGLILCFTDDVDTLVFNIIFTTIFFTLGTLLFYIGLRKLKYKEKVPSFNINDQNQLSQNKPSGEEKYNATLPIQNRTSAEQLQATQEMLNSSISQFYEALSFNNAQAHRNKNQNRTAKCNCDGCPKQDTCEYGHIIYDDITHERMTLADKFIMLESFNTDSFTPNLDNQGEIISNIQDLYSIKSISTYSKKIMQNTLFYLQEQKKLYLFYGKCGRAYFNLMNMNVPINNLKSALKYN